MKNFTTATINAVKNIDRNALQALNKAYRLDYNKPINYFTFEGSFTTAALFKAITAAGIKTTGAFIGVLMPDYYYRNENRYKLAVIDQYGDIMNTTTATGYSGSHYELFNNKRHYNTYIDCMKIDRFYRKGDFNEARKAGDTLGLTYIVIVQDLEHMTPYHDNYTERRNTNTYSRYKLQEVRKGRNYNSSEDYITALDLIDEAGITRSYVPFYYGNNRPTDTAELIDKSGYLVQPVRDNLITRAEKVKEERAKAAYLETDNTARIKALREQAAALKEIAANKCKLATTAAELKKVKDILYNWSYSLIDIYERIEHMEARIKDYRSIEDFNESADYIQECINQLKNA